jgi:hypothetical protein
MGIPSGNNYPPAQPEPTPAIQQVRLLTTDVTAPYLFTDDQIREFLALEATASTHGRGGVGDDRRRRGPHQPLPPAVDQTAQPRHRRRPTQKPGTTSNAADVDSGSPSTANSATTTVPARTPPRTSTEGSASNTTDAPPSPTATTAPSQRKQTEDRLAGRVTHVPRLICRGGAETRHAGCRPAALRRVMLDVVASEGARHAREPATARLAA